MKQISNKEYEKYQQYLTDQLHGRTLTPDGLRIICDSFGYDPKQFGSTCRRFWQSSGAKELCNISEREGWM